MHKRDFGPGALNFTAYLESQHGWGKDRTDRPDILFQYQIPETGWLASVPLWLKHHENGIERVVVDVINHRPLKAYENLPITISKKVEGWLMEAWSRQDRNIDVEDLIQRMPYAANDDVWKTRKFSNALTQRKERFRNRGRCLSWKMIEHDREWDKQLKKEMNASPAWVAANTTKYLQDLTRAEDSALEAATFISRKHIKRANGRELDGLAKVEKELKMRKKLEGGKKNAQGMALVAHPQELEQSSNVATRNCPRKSIKRAKKSGIPDSGPRIVDAGDNNVHQPIDPALEEFQRSQAFAAVSSASGSRAPVQATPSRQRENPQVTDESNQASSFSYTNGYLGRQPYAAEQFGQVGDSQSANDLSGVYNALFPSGSMNNDLTNSRHHSLPASMSSGTYDYMRPSQLEYQPANAPHDVSAPVKLPAARSLYQELSDRFETGTSPYEFGPPSIPSQATAMAAPLRDSYDPSAMNVNPLPSSYLSSYHPLPSAYGQQMTGYGAPPIFCGNNFRDDDPSLAGIGTILPDDLLNTSETGLGLLPNFDPEYQELPDNFVQ